jgi:hypothetical protein
MPGGELLKSTVWHEELGSWYVNGISVDSDGSVWAVAGHYKGDVFVWHLSEDARDHWTLPRELLSKHGLPSISHDLNGNPRVATSHIEASTIYSWEDDGWKQTNSNINFFNNNLHAHDTKLWGIQNGNLAYWDFADNQSGEISSPPEVVANGLRLLDFKVTPNGLVLAKFSEQDKPDTLYKFENGQWQEAVPPFPENEWLRKFCLDGQERIWALNSIGSDHDQDLLGYYDVENQKWRWQNLQPLHTYPIAYFSDIAVDPLGRIWISGMYEKPEDLYPNISFVKVIAWSEDEIIQIEEYNENNSNVEHASSMIVTPDGRIWLHENTLLWIDATSPKLPSPLPDWVNNLDIFEHFGWFIPLIAVQMILLGIAWALEYK